MAWPDAVHSTVWPDKDPARPLTPSGSGDLSQTPYHRFYEGKLHQLHTGVGLERPAERDRPALNQVLHWVGFARMPESWDWWELLGTAGCIPLRAILATRAGPWMPGDAKMPTGSAAPNTTCPSVCMQRPCRAPWTCLGASAERDGNQGEGGGALIVGELDGGLVGKRGSQYRKGSGRRCWDQAALEDLAMLIPELSEIIKVSSLEILLVGVGTGRRASIRLAPGNCASRLETHEAIPRGKSHGHRKALHHAWLFRPLYALRPILNGLRAHSNPTWSSLMRSSRPSLRNI